MTKITNECHSNKNNSIGDLAVAVKVAVEVGVVVGGSETTVMCGLKKNGHKIQIVTIVTHQLNDKGCN